MDILNDTVVGRKSGVFLLLLLISLAGCRSSNLFIRGEYGYGSQWLIAKEANEYQGGIRLNGTPKPALPVDGYYLNLAVIGRTEIADDVKLGLALGPVMFAPTKGPVGEFFGFEVKPRLSYTNWRIQPYLEGLAGAGHTSKRWEGEGSHYQFSVGGGLGLAIPLGANLEIDFGYRIYHISNGSAFFGSPKPNVGYNTDMIYLGIIFRLNDE
jgi:Lipid A 3-O-deacylase (PagL)